MKKSLIPFKFFHILIVFILGGGGGKLKQAEKSSCRNFNKPLDTFNGWFSKNPNPINSYFLLKSLYEFQLYRNKRKNVKILPYKYSYQVFSLWTQGI